MIESKKTSYIPSEKKRYDVCDDTISRERIKAIHCVLHETRGEHTFLVGGIVFGSLIKGKRLNEQTAQETDIDLVLFIDCNNIQVGSDGLTPRNEKWSEWWDLMADESGKMGWQMIESYRTEQAVAGYLTELVVERISEKIKSQNPTSELGSGVYVKKISLLGGRFNELFF